MKNIISETEVMAYEYLKAFGFGDDQIVPLITIGVKDLDKELKKLQNLVNADEVVAEDVNNVLHALKGLLFQLGNHPLAEKVNETRSDSISEVQLEEIRQLLFV